MNTNFREFQFSNFKWVDILDPNKSDLDTIAEEFNLNYLQIHDSLEVGHLPKYEKQEGYDFLIFRAFTAKPNDRITNINELSNKIAFFYSDSRLMTIHRTDYDFLEDIPAYFEDPQQLMIYIIHKMLRSFDEPSKLLDDKVDNFEKVIFLRDYSKVSLEDLYYLKTETRISKKILQITQNVVNQIEVVDKHKSALQDVKDKLLSLILSYEEVLEDSQNLLNTYLSVNSQRSNDVMKLLTVFSAFFLPLTFIVGVYGMNFHNMPELDWEYGYFGTLAVMSLLAIIIYVWFKKRKFF